MKEIKLMIVGHGRHGKDTVCDLLKAYGYNFTSSSLHCSEVVFDALKDKYGYKDSKECFEDRHSHRKEWFDIITDYNTPDRTRIAREIYKNNSLYAGMRNREEVIKCKEEKVFNYAVWVDASKRLPPESESSMNIRKEDCDFCIDNNGNLQQLSHSVRLFHLMMKTIQKHFFIRKKCCGNWDENGKCKCTIK